MLPLTLAPLCFSGTSITCACSRCDSDQMHAWPPPPHLRITTRRTTRRTHVATQARRREAAWRLPCADARAWAKARAWGAARARITTLACLHVCDRHARPCAVKITWVAEAAALVPFQAEGNLYTGPALARRRCMASGKRTSVMHRSANPLSHALQLSDRRQCAFLHTRNGPHARRAESMQRAPCPTDLQESTRR